MAGAEIEFKEGSAKVCACLSPFFSFLFFVPCGLCASSSGTLCYFVTSVMSCQLYLVMRAGAATAASASASSLDGKDRPTPSSSSSSLLST